MERSVFREAGVTSAGLYLASVLALSCGSAASSSESTAESSPGAAASTLEALSADVSASVDEYGASVLSSDASAASCAARHARYDATVRTMVAQMQEHSGGMDDYMREHAAGSSADYACLSTTMIDELDYHYARACPGSDLGAIQQEASRHVSAMRDYVGHLSDRCREVLRSLDGAEASFSSMAAVCRGWDGRCSQTMHSVCCHNDGSAAVGHHPDGMPNMMNLACADW